MFNFSILGMYRDNHRYWKAVESEQRRKIDELTEEIAELEKNLEQVKSENETRVAELKQKLEQSSVEKKELVSNVQVLTMKVIECGQLQESIENLKNRIQELELQNSDLQLNIESSEVQRLDLFQKMAVKDNELAISQKQQADLRQGKQIVELQLGELARQLELCRNDFKLKLAEVEQKSFNNVEAIRSDEIARLEQDLKQSNAKTRELELRNKRLQNSFAQVCQTFPVVSKFRRDSGQLLKAALHGDNIKLERILTDHPKHVTALLESREDVAPCNTALMFAAMNGFSRSVSLLVDWGADANATNDDGDTALILAADRGRVETIKVLLGHAKRQRFSDESENYDSNSSALIRAASNGHTKAVVLLLSKLAGKVNETEGSQALEAARQKGFSDVAQILISRGFC